MTREEAITIIDNLHLIGCGRNQHENDLKINIALDMAIEALQDRPTPCEKCIHVKKKEANRFGSLAFTGDNDGMLLFPNTYTDIHQYENKPYTVDSDQLKQILDNVYNYFGVNEDVLQNKAYGDAWSAFYECAIEPFHAEK